MGYKKEYSLYVFINVDNKCVNTPKGEEHFGDDGFALTETPYNHVVEKYVFYQRVNSFV